MSFRMPSLVIGRILRGSACTAVWVALWAPGMSYGQSPVRTEGKIYWTHEELGIGRSNLDGSDREPLIVSDLRYPDLIVLDVSGGKMYWTEKTWATLYRSDLDGSDTETLVDLTHIAGTSWNGINFYPGWTRITDVELDLEAGKIYFTIWFSQGDVDGYESFGANLDGSDLESCGCHDPPGSRIIRTIQPATLDSSEIEILSHLYETVAEWEGLRHFAFDLNQGRVYWTREQGTIQRASLDGDNVEVLFAPEVRKPHAIVLDIAGKRMYWTDSTAGSINRADLDGSDTEVLVTGLASPKGIALLEGKIYWADSGTNKIQAANTDRPQVEDILTGLDGPRAVALDMVRSKLYWRESQTINRSDLDGSNPEDLLEVDYWSTGLALDADRGKLYWTEDSRVRRSNLDGSNIEDIVPDTDLGHIDNVGWSEGNGAIALDLVGGKLYWVSSRSAPSIDPIHVPAPWWELTFRCNLDGSHIEVAGGGGNGIALDIPVPTAVSMQNASGAAQATGSLEQNVPNPFNSNTRIPYHLATSGPVRLEICNTLGQRVRTLVNEVQPAGFYHARWDARDREGSAVAAGVYLARLHYPGGVQTRRLLFLK